MDPLMFSSPIATETRTLAFLLLFLLMLFAGPFRDGGRVAHCAKFTFVNRCYYTVWPGVLANSGSPALGTTGFELPAGGSISLQAPADWSGRFWGRTGCALDHSGLVSCATGDCGSGQIDCNGAGAASPATLAEFTLGGASGRDFYDVSLVDGYNLPVVVETSGGWGGCDATGCPADLNRGCPAELRSGSGAACRSACGAFGSPEYCCVGEFASPGACRPSVYSQMFKSACPRSYSYAYDDATSIFTCSGADYFITFCPSGSQKSTQDATTTLPRTTAAGEMTLGNDPWLAGLASGSAATHARPRGALFPQAVRLMMIAATCALILPSFSLPM